MTTKDVQSITCPKCSHEQKFTLYPSINVSLEPKLKEKILDGSFCMFSCKKCSFEGQIAYDTLYHDMKQKIFIYFNNTEKKMTVRSLEKLMKQTRKMAQISSEPDNYLIRLVHSKNDLIEKILLFDEGLNDKVIELLKVPILSENDMPLDTELYFEGIVKEKGKKCYCLTAFGDEDSQEEFIVNPKEISEVIEHIESALSQCDAGLDLHENKALRIDRDFARKMFE
ncbi:MAG: CpXC domain-containing protein [Candidatus Ozemobacteraceae bacterium]